MQKIIQTVTPTEDQICHTLEMTQACYSLPELGEINSTYLCCNISSGTKTAFRGKDF